MADRKREVLAKLRAFVDAHYAGDLRKAFDDRDHNCDGRIDVEELRHLFYDAGVGTVFTRIGYAVETMRVLDLDRDGGVSWAEFEAAVKL